MSEQSETTSGKTAAPNAAEVRADFVEQLDSKLAGFVNSIALVDDEIEVHLTADQLIEAMTKLRDSSALLFSTLIDVTAVDYPSRVPQFEMVYILLSMKYNQRVRVKMAVTAQDLTPSVTSIWSAANWYEREIWDMYGPVSYTHLTLPTTPYV